jgi:hypothetical protein
MTSAERTQIPLISPFAKGGVSLNPSLETLERGEGEIFFAENGAGLMWQIS